MPAQRNVKIQVIVVCGGGPAPHNRAMNCIAVMLFRTLLLWPSSQLKLRGGPSLSTTSVSPANRDSRHGQLLLTRCAHVPLLPRPRCAERRTTSPLMSLATRMASPKYTVSNLQ